MTDIVDLKSGAARSRSDLRRFLDLARKGGMQASFAHAVRVLGYRLLLKKFDRDFDQLLGSDTDSEVAVTDLDLDGPNRRFAVEYSPTRGRLFAFMLRDIPEELSRFTFVDIGSGKGRILCIASLFDFRRIVGVELSHRLHLEAERNVRRMLSAGRSLCRDISLSNMDATQFEFPRTDLIVYMYNPFMSEVMEQVVRNLERSWDGTKSIYVIYYHPVCRRVLDDCGFLSATRQRFLSRLLHPALSSAGVAIYRTRREQSW